MILKILTQFKRDTNHIKTMEDNQQSCTTKHIFDETDIYPDGFIKHCKNNSNDTHNISIEVKK